MRLKWNLISVLLEIVLILTPNVPKAQKSFRMHPIELLGDVGHAGSHFFPFGDSVSIGAR
jgi:hypothetical protein